MKDIDLNLILKLNEFRQYLCNRDLMQLSMCCKKSRILLTKVALNTLNLQSFTSGRDYSSLYIQKKVDQYAERLDTFINPYKPLMKELIKLKNEFIDDLKHFNGKPKILVVTNYGGCHYLLNEIPSIFPNITTLVLNSSMFTIETIRYLLDNFKCLENLELTYNLIYHKGEISYEYAIAYPISLRSMKIGYNRCTEIRDKFNSIDIQMDSEDDFEEFELVISPQHLLNLVTFDYEVDDYQDEDEDLFQFIILNPQINTLKISEWGIYNELFAVIKYCENLTHLECKRNYDDEESSDYEMPVLQNIKYLHLKNSDDCVNAAVISNFPNIDELVIEFDKGINNEKK